MSRKRRRISIDALVQDYIRENQERFIGFKSGQELKNRQDKVTYQIIKASIIHEISRQPSIQQPLGLTQIIYRSKCHELPVIDVKGVSYCSFCGYETKVKTKVRESAYGIIKRISTITPEKGLRQFDI